MTYPNSDKEQNTTRVQSETLSYVPFDLEYSKVFIVACDLDKTLYPIYSTTNKQEFINNHDYKKQTLQEPTEIEDKLT